MKIEKRWIRLAVTVFFVAACIYRDCEFGVLVGVVLIIIGGLAGPIAAICHPKNTTWGLIFTSAGVMSILHADLNTSPYVTHITVMVILNITFWVAFGMFLIFFFFVPWRK